MLRAFVVFLEVALLVILLRTSFVQYWLSDIQTTVSGWMISISEIPERQELGRMRDDLYPEITDMSESQIKYLDSILQNKASLKVSIYAQLKNNLDFLLPREADTSLALLSH